MLSRFSKKLFSENKFRLKFDKYAVFVNDFSITRMTKIIFFGMSVPFVSGLIFKYIWSSRLTEDYRTYLINTNLGLTYFFSVSVIKLL
jgi:hypothetical protein